MKATATTTTTTLLALASTLVGAATACRQLSCAGDACEATPEQAAVRLCDALSGLQSGATARTSSGATAAAGRRRRRRATPRRSAARRA